MINFPYSKPGGYPCPPPPQKPSCPPPQTPPRVPGETLPIYPTYSTQVIHGVTYKTYLETDWHQVMTEDGVTLYEVLKSLPILNTDGFYTYKGTLKDRPDITAMDQLYSITDQEIGDVYLVETSMLSSTGRVCEVYAWLDNSVGWVFHGTTDKKSSIEQSLPEVLKLTPTDLGKPGQVMVVSTDGKRLVWGSSGTSEEISESIKAHDNDISSHQDIRDELALKADKMNIFNDVIKVSGWNYNSSYPCFEYIYTNENIPNGAYFELIPLVNSQEESSVISSAGFLGVFELNIQPDTSSYATLRAMHVPTADINICVKVFGTFR